MLHEYIQDRSVWEQNPDEINVRSDLLGTNRVLDLIGECDSKTVLDIGCGNGKASRALARKGARVIGIDVLPEQIETAQSLEAKDQLGIEYFVGDIRDLKNVQLPVEKYDLIISLMVHLYLDEQEFQKSMQDIAARLNPGGRFIYLNVHPVRVLLEDEDMNYFQTTEITGSTPLIDGTRFETTYYNHPLNIVLNSLIDAGLQIKNVVEPYATKEEMKKYGKEFLSDKDRSLSYIIVDSRLEV